MSLQNGLHNREENERFYSVYFFDSRFAWGPNLRLGLDPFRFTHKMKPKENLKKRLFEKLENKIFQ